MRFKQTWLLWEADKGNGSGEEDKTEDATGNENGGTQEPTFTQADVDKIVQERLARERQKAEERERKAREEAEAKALAENDQYKELSEKQAKQLLDAETELADAKAQLDAATQEKERYQQALEGYVAKQREGVPDHIGALLDNLDPVAQLEWLTVNSTNLGQANGVPATPKAKGGLSDAQKEEAQTASNRYYRDRF